MEEDQRVTRLRDLLQDATKLQEAATRLINDITDQLQRSIFIHDDRPRGPRREGPERRGKPRE